MVTTTIQRGETTKGPRGRVWRWLGRAGAGCLILWLGLAGYVNWAMHQPPEVFGGVMARMPMPAFFVLPFETLWSRARGGDLHPGDRAPDFTLRQLQGSEAPVGLAGLWKERPVVLVFGSYT